MMALTSCGSFSAAGVWIAEEVRRESEMAKDNDHRREVMRGEVVVCLREDALVRCWMDFMEIGGG